MFVWSILQKFRGFKLICKHFIIHFIIIKINQPISWVKSTHYDGLNKQRNLLGKINPKCVLSCIYPALGLKTTQIGLKCFLECMLFITDLETLQNL